MVRKSKYTKHKLTITQTKAFMELFKEVVTDLLLEEDSLVLENFVKFEIKELKSKQIRNVTTGELDTTRELKVPSVRLSRKLREEIKKEINFE